MPPAAAVVGRTAAELTEAAVSLLSRLRVPESRPSVEFIMADVLHTDRLRARLEGNRVLSRSEALRFRKLVALRARRSPLAYVLGHQDFLGLRFLVRPGVLCPRPETEELAEAACRLLEHSPSRKVLDIGTGTGCLAVSIAKRFIDASVTAVDVSPKALALARANARTQGVSSRVLVKKHDLFKPFPFSGFDLVVSNPPYVPSGRLKTLSAEVRAEPRLSLDGGKDGLKALRAIIAAAPGLLVPGGHLVLEMDRSHAARVKASLDAEGFAGLDVLKDFRGNDRIAVGAYMLSSGTGMGTIV